MAIFKCRDCSHEVASGFRPSECEICGSSNLILLDITGSASNVNNEIFNTKEFSLTIQNYCNKLEWKISDIDENHAILQFDMESGSVQTLYIFRHRNILEFCCPSCIRFTIEKYSIYHHYISTFLLKENNKYTLGFWCIQEIAGCHVFSIMHNAAIILIDINYFSNVVAWLVEECEQFEQAIKFMGNSD
jgi:hypothetical protein